LKLENILVDYKDNQSNDLPVVKVIDFGSTFEIAKGLPKIVFLSLSQTITPEYMPPELLMQFDKNGI
jgi:serine/threonine protein kinase